MQRQSTPATRPTSPRFLTMPASTSSQSLLEELDTRQNEVLEQLEELNARIERVLKECLLPNEPTLRLVAE